MEAIADIQDEYIQALEAWETEQASRARSAEGEDAPVDDGSASSQPRFADFQDALSRMIAGIESAANVVRSNSPDAAPGRESTRNDGVDGPGIQGVAIGEGSSQRRLVRGASPDISAVDLPSAFPPEYAAVVDFSVAPDGTVTSARLRRPTPAPQLDARLVATVRAWRFEPAPGGGSGAVSGSVTIIVDTRSES